MAAYVGESEEDLNKVVKGLREAAHSDRVAKSLGMKEEHNDGWGYVICSDHGVSFYKTAKPMYDDLVQLPQLKGRIHAVIHARQASPGKPIGPMFSHPFFGETKDAHLFLAHNGSLDEKKEGELRKQLNFHSEAIDSEVALRYMLKSSDIHSASAELEGYVKQNSALNLLILEVRRKGTAEVYIKNYYRWDKIGRNRAEYYRIFKQRLNGGMAVFSSSLNDYDLKGDSIGKEGLFPLSELM